MIWTFVFCLLKKKAGLHLGFQTVPVSLGSVCSLATQRAKVPFLVSDPISSLHILERLSHHSSNIIMGCFLLLEESTYCQGESSCIIFLCSRNDLVVTRRCLKLSDRSLGSTWDTVHGDKPLCYFDGETFIFPLSTSVQGSVGLGQTHKFFLYCWWENTASR